MMINRNNYEEFFLMYVDDELTPQQRSEVETFVQQNADLKSEFEMLQQTKLDTKEDIEFAHKTELLKIKESIALDNYQEYFLLYIDNELNEENRQAVEKFVLQHPALQEEFTLLKQTVLPQEKIVFHYKRSLYKKEERRIVYFNWTRIAAAAAVIGAAVLVWWVAPHGSKEADVASVQQSKSTTQPAQQQRKDSVQQFIQPSTNSAEQVAANNNTKQNNRPQLAVTTTEKKKTIKPVEERKQKDDLNIALNNNATENATKEDQQVIADSKKDLGNTNPIVATIDEGNTSKEMEDPLEKAKSTNAVNTKTPKDIVQPAIYKELNTDDDVNTNNGLYIGNMEINKNQVRGFMKRIGGLFSGKSKNSSNEKGKLQVANFELNTN